LFEILSEPNEWEESLRTQDSEGKILNESKSKRISFWEKFVKNNENGYINDYLLGARGSKSVYDVSLGGAKTYIRLKKLLDRINVELITEKPTDQVITLLNENLVNLEKKVGKLEWISEEGCQRKRLVLSKEIDTKNESNWSDSIDWLSSNSECFHKHFFPIVQRLKS
jgi:hypothetical protein